MNKIAETSLCRLLYEHKFSASLVKYQEAQMLHCMVSFLRNHQLSYKVTITFCLPTNNESEFC